MHRFGGKRHARTGSLLLNRRRIALALTAVAWLPLIIVSAPVATGTHNSMRRVSVSSTGNEGDAHSVGGSVSGDGRYVAFSSEAANLVPGDTNGVGDVFLRDVETGATSLVSIASNGDAANGASFSPSVSDDGRLVAFDSVASNLVVGDTSVRDVFVRDMSTGTTTRISIGAGDSGGLRGSSRWGRTVRSL